MMVCYTQDLTIGKIIDKIDKKYLVNPLERGCQKNTQVVYMVEEKMDNQKVESNQKDHKVMSEMLFDRLCKI